MKIILKYTGSWNSSPHYFANSAIFQLSSEIKLLEPNSMYMRMTISCDTCLRTLMEPRSCCFGFMVQGRHNHQQQTKTSKTHTNYFSSAIINKIN